MLEPLLWGASIATGFDLLLFDIGEKKYILSGMKYYEVDKAAKKYVMKRSIIGMCGTFLFSTIVGINTLVVNLGMFVGGIIAVPIVLCGIYKLKSR